MPFTLSPDTGYNIGEKTMLFLLIKWTLQVKKLASHEDPVNPQKIKISADTSLNIELGEVLDAIHVMRESDRAHLLGISGINLLD